MKRYRIRAWGSDVHPDLDYESDERDNWVRQYYPFTDTTCQVAVTAESIFDLIGRA